MNLVGQMLNIFKQNPQLLIRFLNQSDSRTMANFMNGLPNFYFDYTQLYDYAQFLKIFFAQRAEKGMLDYLKDGVGSEYMVLSDHLGIQLSLLVSYVRSRQHQFCTRNARRYTEGP